MSYVYKKDWGIYFSLERLATWLVMHSSFWNSFVCILYKWRHTLSEHLTYPAASYGTQMRGWITTTLTLCSDRDAVVGALMPAGMLAPVECPSFSSSAPASDVSAMASPMHMEDSTLAADLEDRLSPNLWQEKREVKGNLKATLNLKGKVAFLYLGNPTSSVTSFCVRYLILSLT